MDADNTLAGGAINSISASTARCIVAFERCSSIERALFRKENWTDHEFARFRVWYSNLGALAIGDDSAEYRLRDCGERREDILNLLNIIGINLYHIASNNSDVQDDISTGEDISSTTSSISITLSSLANSISESSKSTTFKSVSEARDEVEQSISRLQRLEETLRHSGRRLVCLKEVGFDDGDDNELVFMKLSTAVVKLHYPSAEIWFQDRVARSLAHRRNILAYRRSSMRSTRNEGSTHIILRPYSASSSTSSIIVEESRAKKLGKKGIRLNDIVGRGKNINAKEGHISESKESVVEDAVEKDKKGKGMLKAGSQKNVESVPQSNRLHLRTPRGDSSADAPDLEGLHEKWLRASEEYLSEDKLRFPAEPTVDRDDDYFECPYCFIICHSKTASGEHWTEHVLKDLAPYICVSRHCKEADAIFETRFDWIEHIRTEHTNPHWICMAPAHGPQKFATESMFLNHMKDKHAGTFPPSQLSVIADMSLRPSTEIVETCPFCSKVLEEVIQASNDPITKFTVLEMHISRHMEILALLSLLWLEAKDEDASHSDEGSLATDNMDAMPEAHQKIKRGSFLRRFIRKIRTRSRRIALTFSRENPPLTTFTSERDDTSLTLGRPSRLDIPKAPRSLAENTSQADSFTSLAINDYDFDINTEQGFDIMMFTSSAVMIKTPSGELKAVKLFYDTGSTSNWASERFVQTFGFQKRPILPDDLATYATIKGEYTPRHYVMLELQDRSRGMEAFEKLSFNVTPSLDGIGLIIGSASMHKYRIAISNPLYRDRHVTTSREADAATKETQRRFFEKALKEVNAAYKLEKGLAASATEPSTTGPSTYPSGAGSQGYLDTVSSRTSEDSETSSSSRGTLPALIIERLSQHGQGPAQERWSIDSSGSIKPWSMARENTGTGQHDLKAQAESAHSSTYGTMGGPSIEKSVELPSWVVPDASANSLEFTSSAVMVKEPSGEKRAEKLWYDPMSVDSWVSEKFLKDCGLTKRPLLEKDVWVYSTVKGDVTATHYVDVELKDSGRGMREFDTLRMNVTPHLDGIGLLAGRIFMNKHTVVLTPGQRDIYVTTRRKPNAEELEEHRKVMQQAEDEFEQAEALVSTAASTSDPTAASTTDEHLAGSSQTSTSALESPDVDPKGSKT